MKKTFLILTLFFTSKVWGQYSGITYFPGEKSFMLSLENTDGKGWGLHVGGGYNMWMVSSPINSVNPSPYLDRFGINYGLFESGFVVGSGIKFNTLPNTNKDIRPEVWFKLHPIKLISQNRDSWDISVTYSFSKEKFWGFGLSIPIQYRYSYLL